MGVAKPLGQLILPKYRVPDSRAGFTPLGLVGIGDYEDYDWAKRPLISADAQRAPVAWWSGLANYHGGFIHDFNPPIPDHDPTVGLFVNPGFLVRPPRTLMLYSRANDFTGFTLSSGLRDDMHDARVELVYSNSLPNADIIGSNVMVNAIGRYLGVGIPGHTFTPTTDPIAGSAGSQTVDVPVVLADRFVGGELLVIMVLQYYAGAQTDSDYSNAIVSGAGGNIYSNRLAGDIAFATDGSAYFQRVEWRCYAGKNPSGFQGPDEIILQGLSRQALVTAAGSIPGFILNDRGTGPSDGYTSPGEIETDIRSFFDL